ncbi:MAG TPA: type I restriction enzyme HsdR N-terminal domain-containing protein [Candidatus Coprenecus stercoripullorum]|nr:type I restriction enzyme HsdR N-terminal domain-containing protein [Candidatus Coprenecus stercoripullorum]
MEGKLFDPLRQKEVAATPEETVRQRTISWLNEDRGIPLSMMASEYSFRFNGMLYRADIVVFGRDRSPLMLVECKAPSVTLGKDVLYQVIRYNRVLGVRFIMITNGRNMYLCGKAGDGNEYAFLSDLPDFGRYLKNRESGW